MLSGPEKPVICNNSPLVALWTLDLLSLLRDFYTEVLILLLSESRIDADDADERGL